MDKYFIVYCSYFPVSSDTKLLEHRHHSSHSSLQYLCLVLALPSPDMRLEKDLGYGHHHCAVVLGGDVVQHLHDHLVPGIDDEE